MGRSQDNVIIAFSITTWSEWIKNAQIIVQAGPLALVIILGLLIAVTTQCVGMAAQIQNDNFKQWSGIIQDTGESFLLLLWSFFGSVLAQWAIGIFPMSFMETSMFLGLIITGLLFKHFTFRYTLLENRFIQEKET